MEEDIRPEIRDDIYDPSYQDKEGPNPKLEYVWRNIILMSVLHLGALYGITWIPTCKMYTLLWGKSSPCPPDPVPQVLSPLNKVGSYIEQKLQPFQAEVFPAISLWCPERLGALGTEPRGFGMQECQFLGVLYKLLL